MSDEYAAQGTTDAEVQEGLRIARSLISAGVPVFAAPPCPAAHGGECPRPGHSGGKEEYDLPPKWQMTVPSEVWLERWQPGYALAAVGGHVADFLDVDGHRGGYAGMQELEDAGHWPRVFGIAETPSGGQHALISPIGESRLTDVAPGVDYQGGQADGTGRAFVWIAPTVKRSKAEGDAGQVKPYRWLQEPDLEYLAEFAGGGDDSGMMLAARIQATRARESHNFRQEDMKNRYTGTERAFTETEAQAYCRLTLDRLMQAEIGQIEERANDAACQLSHFVPEFWSPERAYEILGNALAQTAYNPNGPSSWTAEKFRRVLSGDPGRAPGDWKAVRRPESVDEVQPDGDAVDALIAEMRSAADMSEMQPPKALVQKLLTLDSESWIIGEPGSKKSFVALDIAAHVIRGQDWQGHRVTPGRVVMIVAEGASGTGKRIRAWEKVYGQMDPDGDQLYVLPRPVQARDYKAWATLVEACRRLEPVLVVIDTQARVTVGLKENDATDMGIYVDAQRALRAATGACVLTIHHTGREGGNARGSSALDGAQGTELKVVTAGPLRGSLVTEKQKDMEEAPPVPLTFQVVELGLDEDGEPITSLAVAPADPFGQAEGLGEVDGAAEPGQALRVREPQEWTLEVFPNVQEAVKRRILQVLQDIAGQTGLTEVQVRSVVADRWHGGVYRTRRGGGALSADTWLKSWTAVMEAEKDGERWVGNPSGSRVALNPVLLEGISGLSESS